MDRKEVNRKKKYRLNPKNHYKPTVQRNIDALKCVLFSFHVFMGDEIPENRLVSDMHDLRSEVQARDFIRHFLTETGTLIEVI